MAERLLPKQQVAGSNPVSRSVKKINLFLLLVFFFLFPKNIFAEGNKFGIHILEPSDLPKAAELVNSNGGDWGFVTIVIRQDDLNFQKWQDFMDFCREKHLISLVRLATQQEKDFWTVPSPSDSQKWLDFLTNLNWPIKDKYIIVFNEPNQAKEWGGKINPEEYAKVLAIFAEKFHQANSHFKILNAGFDLAAPNSKTTMDVFRFWQRMEKAVPGIFNQLDGWASHSYPNHGFRGKPTDSGRLSVRGYQWELATLKKYFNLKKDLPVFITETGWVKDNLKFKIEKGKSKKSPLISPERVAEYFKLTFENLWLKDERIFAVTPFVLNYPQHPFAEFSWLDEDGNPYPQYLAIQALPKKSWWPPQEEKYTLGEIIIPPFMLTESSFQGKISLKNSGQSILGEKTPFFFKSFTDSSEILLTPATLSGKLKPGQEGFLEFQIKTASNAGEFNLGWEGIGGFQIKVFAPSVLKKVEYSFWEKIILNFRQYLKRLGFLLK